MSLFDFFFPTLATAHHLREIRSQLETQQHTAALERFQRMSETTTSDALKMRIDELEGDLGFVVLVLGSLLSALDEKGVITRDDVKRELAELDPLDGKTDGKLDIRVLKQYMNSRNAGG